MPEDVHPLDDELVAAFLDKMLLEKVKSVLGGVWLQSESCEIRQSGLD
jgi:hypothetical protein